MKSDGVNVGFGVIHVGGSAGCATLSVRSTTNSDRKRKGLASVAKCHKATFAPAANRGLSGHVPIWR
jgi:hypothetical protein